MMGFLLSLSLSLSLSLVGIFIAVMKDGMRDGRQCLML